MTPLAYEGFVYAPLVYQTTCGIRVRNLQTGEIVGKNRKLAVDFTAHHRDASPVMAGGHIVVTTSGGTMIYLKPGADWAEAARASLGGPSGATPCFAGKRLYTRTDKELLCLGIPR